MHWLIYCTFVAWDHDCSSNRTVNKYSSQWGAFTRNHDEIWLDNWNSSAANRMLASTSKIRHKLTQFDFEIHKMRDTMQSKKHQVRKWYVRWEIENINRIVDNKQSSWLNCEYYSSELCSGNGYTQIQCSERMYMYSRERKTTSKPLLTFRWLNQVHDACMQCHMGAECTVQVQCTRMRVGTKFSLRWSDDSALAGRETLLLTWQRRLPIGS